MANRITEGIAKCADTIKTRIATGATTQEKVDDLGKGLDMSMEEYCHFQNLKSIASMDGRLSLEEAQTIYAMIGELPSTFNALPVAHKVVLTEVYSSLLKS